MSDLRTAGFHHITMVSANAARTLHFYRDVLGVGLVKRTVNFDDPGAYHLYFGDPTGSPGTLLTFFEWPHAGPGRWGIGGVHHLALGTATEETQLKWKRRLMDHGVPVTGPYDRGYFTSLYFADPDGQILEIATRGPGYAIDEEPDALGGEMRYPGNDIVIGGRDEAAIAARTYAEPVPVITPDMVLEGMHHISAITDDLDRAGAFYEEALGLSLIKRTINRDAPDIPHYFWARNDGGTIAPHSALTLFGFPPRGKVARGGVGQTHHIAFRAASADEQVAWQDRLRSLGVEVTPVLDRTYFTSIYFRAPDGLLLEIATDGPGFLIDEPAGSLGTELRLPAWLEPRRDEILATLAPLG
jgi:glyoxalase family protein